MWNHQTEISQRNIFLHLHYRVFYLLFWVPYTHICMHICVYGMLDCISYCQIFFLSDLLLLVFSCSHVWLFATPWTAAHQAFLSFTISQSLLKLMSIDSVMPSSYPIPSIVVPFSSCPQSFPASGSFLMSQPFASGGQSIGASASALVLLMNIQDWFPD